MRQKEQKDNIRRGEDYKENKMSGKKTKKKKEWKRGKKRTKGAERTCA